MKRVKIDSLPKAQTGLDFPLDADRYGINKFIPKGDDTQYVDPALFQQVQDLQNRINPLAQSSTTARQEYEKKVLDAINKVESQNYDVTTSGYIPESVRQSEDVKQNGLNGCISGVCYTLNEAGEPVRYYSNSMFQDAIKSGTEKDWALDFDTKNISGGDIVQFTGDREGPHHAALVVPNSIVNNQDGTITFEAFMNSGDGPMYRKSYTLDPKEDRVDNFRNETIQLLKRKNVSDLDNLVSQRDKLKAQIEAADPSAFKKGRARRWNTYMPGAFTEVGVDYTRFDGQDPERMVAGSMMQNLNLEDAARLLRQTTISTPKPIDGIKIKFDSKYDVDYDALRKTAGFENILNQINDPEFKMNFMKDMNITNREYNALVLNSFGLYGQESGFGTKTGGIEETDAARNVDSVIGNIKSRLQGKGAFKKDVDEDYSRGLTQVKLRNIKGQDRRQYGIDKESVEDDPTKAFMAAMIVNAQNLPELRKLADKGETDALNMSNYLDFIPYMYNQPNRIRRGDRKTIEQALAEGKDPAQALVIDPNSPMANNEYVKNVRTYSDLLKFMPLAIDTVPKRFGGSLPKEQNGGGIDYEAIKDPQLAVKARAMGHNSIAEYRNSNWGYGSNHPNYVKKGYPESIYVNDPRTINATTGKPINPNVDLKGGDYSTSVMGKIARASRDFNLDPHELMAMGLQESLFGKTDPNIGHTLNYVDPEERGAAYDMAYAKSEKNKLAESLGYKDNDLYRIQTYNGLGRVYPKTEAKYHGYIMDRAYGVELPQEGISMLDNPLYGKRIIDLRDNVLKNPVNKGYNEFLNKYNRDLANEDRATTNKVNLYKALNLVNPEYAKNYAKQIQKMYSDSLDQSRLQGEIMYAEEGPGWEYTSLDYDRQADAIGKFNKGIGYEQIPYKEGGDISVPSLKRVKVNGLPKNWKTK